LASQQSLFPNGPSGETAELPLDSPAFQDLPSGLPSSPLSVLVLVVGEGWGYLLPSFAAVLRTESSSLVVFSPPPPPAVSHPPFSVVGGLEMELFAEAEPSPLACCPLAKFKRKVGVRSSDWVLQLLEEFSLFVGHSCDGFERRLLTLFTDIIASNEAQGAGSRSKVGKKV
jgi:hypothetical protein